MGSNVGKRSYIEADGCILPSVYLYKLIRTKSACVRVWGAPEGHP